MRRLAQFVRLHLSRVCVHLSRVRLASVCVCSRQGFRMRASARVYLLASICSRLSASVCVCLHLSARVCLTSVVLSCVCSRLSHVGRLILRLSASVSRASRVCLRLFTSRVPNARVCVCLASRICLRRSSCLASVCPCECLRELAHFMSVVIQRVQKVFAIVILSYNVPMPKYPSHHLIYVFYHPMPIMPLY